MGRDKQKLSILELSFMCENWSSLFQPKLAISTGRIEGRSMDAFGQLNCLPLIMCVTLVTLSPSCGGFVEAQNHTEHGSTTEISTSTSTSLATSTRVSTASFTNSETNTSVHSDPATYPIVGTGTGTGTSTISPRVPFGHRATASSCANTFSLAEPVLPVSEGSLCTTHADCNDGLNGKCERVFEDPKPALYICTYANCTNDVDCGKNAFCFCSSSAQAQCLSVGNCRTDSDCNTGEYSYCSPSSSWDCINYRLIDGLHCHTPSDSCIDDSDCSGSEFCNYDSNNGYWRCFLPDTDCIRE
jgi:hypothetical protein